MWFLIFLALLIGIIYVYRYPLINLIIVHGMGCKHKVISEAPSPDGLLVATVSERNCGAVTHYERIVSIRHRGRRFDGEDYNSWVFVTADQPTIQVRWQGRGELSVTTDGYSRTPRDRRLKAARWENVEVVQALP